MRRFADCYVDYIAACVNPPITASTRTTTRTTDPHNHPRGLDHRHPAGGFARDGFAVDGQPDLSEPDHRQPDDGQPDDGQPNDGSADNCQNRPAETRSISDVVKLIHMHCPYDARDIQSQRASPPARFGRQSASGCLTRIALAHRPPTYCIVYRCVG